MFRSVRFRLTLWYGGILAAILCLFGWVLYSNVAASLAQDVDDLLASQADGVADTIFAYLEAQTKEEGAPVSRDLQKEVEEGTFPSLVNRWSQETGEHERLRPIRLIDRDGHPLIATKNFIRYGLPITPTALKHALLAQTVYETFVESNWHAHLITRPVVEENQVMYIVQVASSLRQVDASLGRLRLWLIWLIPLTILVTSAVGWFLTKAALKPVGLMITQAQRISVDHLHERIDVPRTGDEVERLAATFNSMLTRLERAFRRLRQFSAAASHELRTPLTIMKGELELALRRPRSSEEYQQALQTHLEALNEMSQIVEQLLTLARSEGGEGAVDWRPVELGTLLRHVRDGWKTISSGKGIEVQVYAIEPMWVRGEQRLLERLIANLLDNALKHTPPKGKVTMRLERRGDYVCLIVKDTGSGISVEELPGIFERFFIQESGKDQSTGLGLGLCRWIAEAHQGQIEAANVEGGGATFTVSLPQMKNL